MRASTVDYSSVPELFDVPKRVRGVMAEEKVSASDLSRSFGGAVSYWTNRISGRYAFTPGDLSAIALMCRRHVAELVGGQAPDGWEAPEPPRIPSGRADTLVESACSSTDRASDYGSVVRLPIRRPVLTLIKGLAS